MEDEAPRLRRALLKFAEGPVVVICPEVPVDERGPLADDRSPNFTQLLRYADIDALLQVFGHLRAANPSLRVITRLPSTVQSEELQNHLVLLGGVGWNRTTKRILAALERLPVEQIEDPRLETGDIFRLKKEANNGNQEVVFFPVMEREPNDEGPGELVEDRALIARLPNPFNTNRTLTVFNGIHSRGVVGAVLAVTDETVRRSNEEFLARQYPAGDFAMIVKVPVLSGYALAPDLQNDDVRVFEWDPDDAD